LASVVGERLREAISKVVASGIGNVAGKVGVSACVEACSAVVQIKLLIKKTQL
jgi:hypothetical protein